MADERSIHDDINDVEVIERIKAMMRRAQLDANLMLNISDLLPPESMGWDYIGLIDTIIDIVHEKATDHDLMMQYLDLIEKMCNLQMAPIRK